MNILIGFNFAVLFLVELAMLVSFFIFGMSLNVPTVLKVIIAIAIPGVVAFLWGLFFAPKASINLAQPWNAMGEYALFGLAGWALIASGHKGAGSIFIAVAFLSETISLLAKP